MIRTGIEFQEIEDPFERIYEQFCAGELSREGFEAANRVASLLNLARMTEDEYEQGLLLMQKKRT